VSTLRLHVHLEPTIAPLAPASKDDRELLSSLLAVRGFGVVTVDRDANVIACNPTAAEVLGVPAADLEGHPLRHFCELSANGAPLSNDRHPVGIARRTGAAHDAGVLKVTRPGGSHRWIRIEAVPLLDDARVVDRVLLTLTDVTAAHEYEERLRLERCRVARAGDRFRRVLESVPDAIAVYHEHRLGYANPALLALLGHGSVAELVGKEVTRILPGHTPREDGTSGRRPALREESWQRIDGSFAVVEVAEHGIDLDGEEGTLLIARDITERKRAQMELVQSTRLASVGTLAAGVAHEINNPLTYVISNLDLVSEDLKRLRNVIPAGRLADLVEMTNDARTGAESVRKIVRGLKMFSRADEERRVTLDVKAAIDVSVEMAHNEIRHRARLVKDYGPVPMVSADEGRLGQVFINLLVNAAQAIPEGNVDANEIRVSTRTSATGCAVIEVRDTGAGIPPEVLGRIFDPFFTTKPIGIGTGLGLSICHGLVRELGGELQVESKLHEGTVFRMTLPPATEYRPEVLEPTTIDAPAAAGRARVLIVDDDENVAEVVRRLLSREHDVTVVHDGRSGLDLVVAGESFDIILCDLMMPTMTGMTFHAELSVLAPALIERVVFISGGAFSPGAGAFLDAVPNRRLEKPFDHRALRVLVREFVPASE
jgi:two-component system cell cycle sensor histidine kinase/response regulator CckA